MYYLQLLLNGISLGSVYSMIALGFTLIYSILKFSNFSHGGIMVVSAYVGYTICKNMGLGFIPMMLMTMVFGAMLSCVVQYIGFERLRKTNGNTMLFFVSSSTMGILLQNIIAITFSSTYYSFPVFFKPPFIKYGGFTMAKTDLMMLAISSALIFLLMLVLRKTRLGMSIRAMAMDSGTVYLMGVNVSVVIAITFLISGALGAVAGVFCGMNYALYPQLNNLVFKGMIASILGGLGNISGALYGALMLALMEVLLIHFIGASLMPVFTFLFSMIFLMIRPQGITGKFVMEKV